jgi:hypothetical protein
MKRVFSHPLTVLVIGLLLRLWFVFRLPSSAGDTSLYESLASNWLKQHVYGIAIDGQLTPLDLRMPGYPAYLALMQAISRRSAENARLWVMLGQVLLDLGACLVIAGIAARCSGRNENSSRVFIAALWLAALCPFTANYTAVPLTETLAILTTALVLIYLIPLVNPEQALGDLSQRERFPGRAGLQGWYLPTQSRTKIMKNAALAGICAGLGTLLRPEAPLTLMSCLPVVLWVTWRRSQISKGFRAAGLSIAACLLMLVPWTIRNAVTFDELQPLAPRYATMPGELIPYGFLSWERTWLYRFREVFAVSWKLNGDPIEMEDLPARAFDSPEERQHVAAILEQYNNDSNLTAEQDQQFAQIARARTARHPWRTYLTVPLQRVITLWFTPRVEQLPISGSVFPLAEMWDTDQPDISVTLGLFFVNIFYVALALWGALRIWRRAPEARAALVLLACFVLIRTAFLTTIETPEPRYVLVCYPAVIALAAQAFSRHKPA